MIEPKNLQKVENFTGHFFSWLHLKDRLVEFIVRLHLLKATADEQNNFICCSGLYCC